MSPFIEISHKEVKEINRMQREQFNRLFHLFEPPLPEGVPERLEKIVAAANIENGNVVLDVGSGTGILIPLIQKYAPGRIYACDLSEAMLSQLHKNYPDVETIHSDVRDLSLPDSCVDVVIINACYANIADKVGAFKNMGRMLKPGGRMLISHPLGKSFVQSLKRNAPYSLDDFPIKTEAEKLFSPFGFDIRAFIDEPSLYILVNVKRLLKEQTSDRSP